MGTRSHDEEDLEEEVFLEFGYAEGVKEDKGDNVPGFWLPDTYENGRVGYRLWWVEPKSPIVTASMQRAVGNQYNPKTMGWSNQSRHRR